jgi:L-malate glycosyltransferase
MHFDVVLPRPGRQTRDPDPPTFRVNARRTDVPMHQQSVVQMPHSCEVVERPLRIFHLIKSLGRGGAEMLLPETLRFADRQRFTYGYGYFLPWKDALVPTFHALDAEVTCFPARSVTIPLAAGRVARHLKGWQADLLHCHMPLAGAVGRIAGRLAGIPVVYTEHNTMERFHPLTRWLNRATWGLQDQAIAVSADVAASIRTHTRTNVPLQVVLNGVDVDRFQRFPGDHPAVRAGLGIPAGAPVVGTVAVFRVQKRLDDWLRAARLLRASHPNAHFVIVGDGPLREEIVRLIRELDMEGVVHLPGLQEDVRPYLGAMDVYMMSSMFEGLPVALLEAMAMECPVVSTSVGGIPEAVRSGENGYLVESRQPAALARTTAELLSSPERRRQMGVAARQTVQSRFSMSRMSGQLEQIYLSVLERYSDGSKHHGPKSRRQHPPSIGNHRRYGRNPLVGPSEPG